MDKHILSKSTFIRGSQCLKSLYLYKHRNFLRDPLSPEQRAKFVRGSEVGVYARNLFPGGINCQPNSPSQYRKSVEKTRQVIESGSHDVIYEAAFQYDRVLILLDILVKEKGKWKAYEIKSSLKISDTYLADAALQYHVLRRSGIDLADFSLVHINPAYQRNGGLDIKSLFLAQTVLEEVKNMQPCVEELIKKEKEILTARHSPKIDIGSQCHQPYPCEFIGHCWKHIKPGSIFDMASLSAGEKFELYSHGVIQIRDLPEEKLDSKVKKAEQRALINNTEEIEYEALSRLLNRIKPTFKFIHFLGRRPAIPVYESYRPYDTEPVCISVCTENISADGTLTWRNPAEGTAPDKKVFDFLLKHFDETDTLLTYESDALKAFLEAAAVRNPAFRARADVFIENVVELRPVFDNLWYIHPGLRGDFSLVNIAEKMLDRNIFKLMAITSDTLAANEFARLEQADTAAEKEQLGEAICNYSTFNIKRIRELYRLLQLKLMD